MVRVAHCPGEDVHLIPASVADETLALVDGRKESSKDERKDRHKLHDNVEGRSAGVLEGISDGVTLHSSLVDVKSLALHDAVDEHAALLDVLLGVVPGTSCVGRRDRHLDGRRDGAREKSSNSAGAEHNTSSDGRGDDEKSREDHFAE